MKLNNFSKAAKNYLSNAKMQVSSAKKIYNLIDKYYNNHDEEVVLDLGSGPGTLKHCNETNCPTISFDLSLPMLKTANSKHKINGDAQKLPFMNNTFSLIISNLMLQWPDDKLQVLSEAYRVLKPGGTIILCTLIKPSLSELQESWAQVDNEQHTLTFLDENSYIKLFENVGFTIKQKSHWSQTFYFDNLLSLFRNFKLTGTNLSKSTSGLGGKQKLQQLEGFYQKIATSDGLPISFSYLTIVAKK